MLIEADPEDAKNRWRRGEIANRITRYKQQTKMYFSAVRWMPQEEIKIVSQQTSIKGPSIKIDEPLADISRDILTTRSKFNDHVISPIV